jgi:tight adherence protein C
MILIAALLAFAAISLAVWELWRPKEDVVSRRIRSAPHGGMAVELELRGSLNQRMFQPTAERIGAAVARVMPTSLVAQVGRLLIQADSTTSVPSFFAMWVGSIVAGILFVQYFVRASSAMPFAVLLSGVFGAIVVFVLGPYLLLRRRARRRRLSITRSLPYALDLLVTCVEAGLGVDAAIAVVADKASGPISEAFSRYLRQVGLGRPRRDALADIAERSGVPDLIRLAAVIAQAEEMGTTVGDVLRVQAAELRLTRRQRAQEAAQRAPALMSIPLSTCFMPAMVAVVVVPSIMSLARFVSQLGAGAAGR